LGGSGGGGNQVAGVAGAKECNVVRVIAALALASAASLASAATQNISTLDSTAPWWERVTVTVSGDGHPQACRFESSVRPGAGQQCDVQASAGASAKLSTGGAKDQYTRITFERRFNPGWHPEANQAPAGDMLLARQVMSLAIGAKGRVQGCAIVAASGAMQPQYGCKEASAERFAASASTTAAAPRQVYMTILVYGHSEHVV
jgi:hypothetical protein